MSLRSALSNQVLDGAISPGNAVDRAREHWFAYLLVGPTVVFLLLLMWIPFMRGIWMSLHAWEFLEEPTWIGLENYAYLFSWDPFYTSLKATAGFASATVFQLVVAIVAALTVNEIRQRLQPAMSAVMLMAYTMPPIVTGTLWLYLLNPSFGPIFDVLVDVGLLNSPIFWGEDGGMALAVITGVTVWTFWPFMFIIIFANLQRIPDSYYEVSKVYGANRWQRFRRITLPQLKSAILVAVSIRFIWNLSKISQPLQMTNGGPGYDTSVLAVLLYRYARETGELGLSFAVGMVLFAITMVFVALFIREFERTGGVSE
jgi:ABC-type sugar transport system permease subunit